MFDHQEQRRFVYEHVWRPNDVLLWDNPAVTTISSSAAGDTNANRKVLRWSSEFGKAIDYYFCFGDGTIDTAMKAYRHLTGDVPRVHQAVPGDAL